MRAIIGEKASIASELATAHMVAGLGAVRKARAARSRAVAAAAYERAALEFRKAQRVLAEAELDLLAKAREASGPEPRESAT